jgi:hypothetical protein
MCKKASFQNKYSQLEGQEERSGGREQRGKGFDSGWEGCDGGGNLRIDDLLV